MKQKGFSLYKQESLMIIRKKFWCLMMIRNENYKILLLFFEMQLFLFNILI